MSATDKIINPSESEGSDVNSDEKDQESEYETDIEVDDECVEDYDPSGKTRYLKKCKELGRKFIFCFLPFTGCNIAEKMLKNLPRLTELEKVNIPSDCSNWDNISSTLSLLKHLSIF